MKIGLQLIRFNWDGIAPHQIGAKVAEIARTADDVGFDSLWAMDHFFQMEIPARNFDAQQPMMDGAIRSCLLWPVTRNARHWGRW